MQGGGLAHALRTARSSRLTRPRAELQGLRRKSLGPHSRVARRTPRDLGVRRALQLGHQPRQPQPPLLLKTHQPQAGFPKETKLNFTQLAEAGSVGLHHLPEGHARWGGAVAGRSNFYLQRFRLAHTRRTSNSRRSRRPRGPSLHRAKEVDAARVLRQGRLAHGLHEGLEAAQLNKLLHYSVQLFKLARPEVRRPANVLPLTKAQGPAPPLEAGPEDQGQGEGHPVLRP
jgi:hypothetical protein